METESQPKKRGRPPLLPGQKPKEGNPQLKIRLKPETYSAVLDRGGVEWARRLIEEHLGEHNTDQKKVYKNNLKRRP